MNLTLIIVFVIAVMVIWDFMNRREYLFDRRKGQDHPTLDFYDPEEEGELNEMASFSSRSHTVVHMADRRKRER